jgi:hypothetical protein
MVSSETRHLVEDLSHDISSGMSSVTDIKRVLTSMSVIGLDQVSETTDSRDLDQWVINRLKRYAILRGQNNL